METIATATGCYAIRGEWKTDDNQVIKCWDRYAQPNVKVFSGEVIGKYPLQVGGSATQSTGEKREYIRLSMGWADENVYNGKRVKHQIYGDLVSYHTQLNGWSNVVEIPVGAKFTIEVVSNGDAMSFCRMKVTIHHSEEDIRKLEYKYKLRQLDEQYDEDHTLHHERYVEVF